MQPVSERIYPNLNRRFCLLQACFCFTYCVSVSFLASTLGMKGFAEWEVGVVMALFALVSVLVMPLWGYLADRTCRMRALMMTGCGASVFLYVGISLTDRKTLLIGLVLLLGATTNSVQNMADSWVSRLLNQGYGGSYGSSRAFGSMTFAVTSAVFGLLLTHFGVPVSPVLLVVGNTALLLVSLSLPEPERQESTQKQPSILRVMRLLFENPDYVVFVACYFLGVVAATPINTFYPMHIQQLGGTQTHLGLGYFLMAMSEVPMLVGYQRLEARFGNRLLLSFGLAGMGLRSVLIALSPTPVLAVLAMLSQALAYGFMIPGVVGFISQNVEHRYASSALLVATALGVSLSQIVTNLVSGFVARAIGMRAMILLFAGAGFLAAVLLFGYTAWRARNSAGAPQGRS